MGKATGKQFVKGKSGNPGGRPKILAEVKAAARAYTRDMLTTLVTIARSKKQPAAARVAAAEAVLNRAWGKPTQALELSGPEGGPVEIRAARSLERFTDEDLDWLEAALDAPSGDAVAGRALDALDAALDAEPAITIRARPERTLPPSPSVGGAASVASGDPSRKGPPEG